MSHLQQIFEKAGTDKGRPHEYGPAYQRHFEEVRNDHIQLLEVGIFEGKSLEAWHEYFPNAQITGVDVSPIRKPVVDRIKSIVADINEWMPPHPYDIIIDDGSHQSHDILNTLMRFWPLVQPNGWYVVEDWATQFMGSYGGEETGSEATRFLHKLTDRLLQGIGPIGEIHVYRELTFFRKLPLPVTSKEDVPETQEAVDVIVPFKKPRGRPKKPVNV